jgi:hypothetical protein
VAALEQVSGSVKVLCWPRLFEHKVPVGTQTISYLPFAKQHGYGIGFRGLMVFTAWWWWVAKKVQKMKPDRVVAIDLDAGVICFLFKKFLRIEYHYDQADPMAARFSNPILIKLCDFIERIVIANASSVSFPAISRDLGWNSKATIVENQFISEEEIQKLSTVKEEPGLLFYGGLLIPGRGLEQIIELPAESINGFRIELAGYGPLQTTIMNAVTEKPHIFFHGELSHDRLLELVAKSRAILALYDPTEENHMNLASGKINEARVLKKTIISNHGLGLSSKDIKLINYTKIKYDLPILLQNFQSVKVENIDVPFFSSQGQFAEYFQKVLL